MSSKLESARRHFHNQQMGQLPTLVPGLDPDPPVLLCNDTQPFDHFVTSELRRNGWPATGKTKEEFEADPPTPVKGAVLARKLGKGNGLSRADIDLLADRIKWLQRNRFRWEARNGYAALVGAKSNSGSSLEVSEPAVDASDKLPSDALGEFEIQSVREAEAAIRRDLFPVVPASDSTNRGAVAATSRTQNSAPCSDPQVGEKDAAEGEDDTPVKEPRGRVEANNLAVASVNCDAALAALGRDLDSNKLPSLDDYASVVGEGDSGETDDRLISLRTGQIKSVEGDKVRRLLFGIYYRESHEEIERRALALAADNYQLTGALSGPRTTREDICEVFARLGLDTDV